MEKGGSWILQRMASYPWRTWVTVRAGDFAGPLSRRIAEGWESPIVSALWFSTCGAQ